MLEPLDIFTLLGILIGVAGVIVPVMPGLGICWLSVLMWAFIGGGGPVRVTVIAVCTIWLALGSVARVVWPTRRMNQAGIPFLSLFMGVIAGMVGVFVLPVIGLPIGFVLGIWAAESMRLQNNRAAWESAKSALWGAGLSVLIDLLAATLMTGTWLVGVILS